MPVRPYKIREFSECEDAVLLMAVSAAVSGSSAGHDDGHDALPLVDDDIEEMLLFHVGEVLTRSLRSNVGPQRLSIAFLRARELALGDVSGR